MPDGQRTAAATSVAGSGTEAGKEGVSARAHDQLRQMILHGELPAGEEFSQSELGRRLDVGRTPLRDALRLLQREGLVVSSGMHRSVRISPLSMPDLDDLYSMRVMGEGLAMWLTVPILRDADFARLDEDVELIEQGDAEAHRRFHAGLRVGAGQRLRDHLETLFDHAERYQIARLAGEPDASTIARRLAEHRPILEACKTRNRVLARDLAIDHVAATAEALMTSARHAPFTLPAAVSMAKCTPLDL